MDVNSSPVQTLPLPVGHGHTQHRQTLALASRLERAICTPGHCDAQAVAALVAQHDVGQLTLAVKLLVHNKTSIAVDHGDAVQIACWAAHALSEQPVACAAAIDAAHALGSAAIVESLNDSVLRVHSHSTEKLRQTYDELPFAQLKRAVLEHEYWGAVERGVDDHCAPTGHSDALLVPVGRMRTYRGCYVQPASRTPS